MNFDAYIHISRIYWQKQNKTEIKLDWSVMIILSEIPLPTTLGHLLIGVKEFSPVDDRYNTTKFIMRSFLCYSTYQCFSGPLILYFHTYLLNVTNIVVGFNILKGVTIELCTQKYMLKS